MSKNKTTKKQNSKSLSDEEYEKLLEESFAQPWIPEVMKVYENWQEYNKEGIY